MKQVHLIAALSGFLLVSCAQDDLVVKPGSPTDGSPVTFAMKLGNSSRSSSDETPLQDAGFTNFGVWAVKANNVADFLSLDLGLNTPGQENAQVVMNNYWVKYCTSQHYGSFWSYIPSEWSQSSGVLPNGHTDQFLKYWDGSVTYTYFVGYAPASTEVEFSNGYNAATSTPGNPTLTFPAYTTTAAAGQSYLFSEVFEAENENYISGNPENPQKVPLTYHRLLSQVQIAFWEDIPGYDVELIKLEFNGQSGTHGVVAIPADYNESATTKWSVGSYIQNGRPTVTYSDYDDSVDGNDLKKYTVTFKECSTSTDQDRFDFTIPDAGNTIGKSQSSATKLSTIYNVLPNNGSAQPEYLQMASGSTWKANSGLQFVVNFKLKATDTKEEIIVKGARVYVPADFTAWKQNSLYTYVFQITKDASGTTDGTDPNPGPEDPKPALYPIIFSNLKVENFQTGSSSNDFVINQKLSASSLYFDITGGAESTSTQTLELANYTPDDNIYTWESSDPDVAKVTVDASKSYKATVTPVANGLATITVKDAANKVTAQCTVYVYDLSNASVSVDVDNSETLTNPFSAPLTVTWTSSNEAVATVTPGADPGDNATVQGVSAGNATITCSCTINGTPKTKTWNVTVKAVSVP